MFSNNNRRSGYTGKLLEGDFFGQCVTSWKGDYVPFRSAMKMARDNQPKDSLHEYGLQLRQETARQLNVAVEEVKVFTAFNTPLDQFHGIDAWVEWNNCQVTIDVTCGSKRGYKAQVIVCEEDTTNGFVLAADRIVWALKHPSLRS